jgi:hypothetical protein
LKFEVRWMRPGRRSHKESDLRDLSPLGRDRRNR